MYMPRKYVPHPNHVIVAEPVQVGKNLVYEEYPIQILDYSVKQLWNKSTPLVKVLRVNYTSYGAT